MRAGNVKSVSIFLRPAFAISAVAFVWMVADSILTARRWKREAQRLQAELDELRS